MVNRIAHCSCGILRAETEGEPSLIVACHCRECQRRTGAAFGVSVYFPAGQVRVAGPNTVYTREGQESRNVRFHFCPRCGRTVDWHADLRPEAIGVALGAFADPGFPMPTRSVWEESRHAWVASEHEPVRRMHGAASPGSR